jgi:hypothetical protein
MDDKNYYEKLMEEYDTWEDLVKDLIIERLNEREGYFYYLCDLAYTLFEGENVDGSFTYSTYWSKELIKHYWDEFGEIYDNYIWSVGNESSINVLEEPEKFVVVMLLEQAQTLLSNYDNEFIEDNWNEEIELTKENINKIIESMN